VRLASFFAAFLLSASSSPAAAAPSELAVTGQAVTVRITDGDAISYAVAPRGGYDISAANDFNPIGVGCTDHDGIWDCMSPDGPIEATMVSGSAAADAVSGSCRAGRQAALTFTAGAGDDTAELVGCRATHIDLGDGHDRADVTAGAVTGGVGNDTLAGGPGPVVLSGDDAHDALTGGPGGDDLSGGAGRDSLEPGPGTDVISGGGDFDIVSYADRLATVRVSLDGQSNDGQAGENDHLGGDVEGILAGEGDDELVGGVGANDIDGNAGSDVIDPGPGNDVVHGGSGNDRIHARDGAVDQIYCGAGNDQAILDAFDSATDCEDVQTSRVLMPDVDGDGVLAAGTGVTGPPDCNDTNAAVRPGLLDVPGNRIDEDCSGRDAPYGRVHTAIQWETRGNRFTHLALKGIPVGARAELRCRDARPRRCPPRVIRRSFPNGAESADLRRHLRRVNLRPRTTVEVRILLPGSIGKVARWRTGNRRTPRLTLLCLAPDQLAPHRCR
jgi:Ca2+-binding RTX toxin-like protein